jgi:hypothetical protein
MTNTKNCAHCNDVENSENIYFSQSVKNSKNIIFGFNVINKKNLILNKEASEAEIQEFKNKLKDYDFYQECVQKFDGLKKQYFLEKNVNNINCTNVIGNNLKNCENMFLCFTIQDGAKNCRYGCETIHVMDSMDIYSNGLE